MPAFTNFQQYGLDTYILSEWNVNDELGKSLS